jgi:hypothetical protein
MEQAGTVTKHDHPNWGWVGVAVVVVVVDATGNRTMSDVFQEAVRHPVAGPIVIGSWCYLTAHLIGAIPPRWDALHYLGCRNPRRCAH